MSIPPRPPSRPAPSTPPPPANQQAKTKVLFQNVPKNNYGQRIILYGPGGVGKSTLACLLPGRSAFADADESLIKLKPQLEAMGIDIPLLIPANDWSSLRSNLQASGYDGIQNVILDTWAPIELWCVRHTLNMTLKDNGKKALNVEDYGFGKGWRHVYDTFLPLIGDLDAHMRAGRNVIVIAHDETSKVPNPAGTDFIRWEPKMQHTPNASIRYRMKEWADHVLFLKHDIAVDDAGVDKGKAKGAGYRTMHTAEMPYFLAKSRTTNENIPITLGKSPWDQIIK